MLGDCLKHVRERKPLIHCITNYVTVNDVANMILASGGTPIMADEPQEAAEITSKCDGLVLNMGTINERRHASYLEAGKEANRKGHPVVLDPVGLGVSSYRRKIAGELLSQVKMTVIRGNLSEILTLAGSTASGRGVDAADVQGKSEEEIIALIKKAAADLDCVIAVSGATDYVADRNVCYVIHNGRSEMSRITGTGCQLTGLIASFVTANKDNPAEAAAAAAALMGLAGETGWQHLAEYEGNATYRNRIIDAVYRMDEDTLNKGARYEIR